MSETQQELKNAELNSVVDMSNFEVNRERYGQYKEENQDFKGEPRISEEIVREISKHKNEPEWMLQKRLEGFRLYNELPMPNWGKDLSKIDLSKIHFFMRPVAKRNSNNWDDVPED